MRDVRLEAVRQQYQGRIPGDDKEKEGLSDCSMLCSYLLDLPNVYIAVSTARGASRPFSAVLRGNRNSRCTQILSGCR